MSAASHGRPSPLLTRAHVTAAIGGLVSLLVTLGVFPATVGKSLSANADVIVSAAFLAATVAPVYVHAFLARKDVTPVSDPRAIDGQRLVPAGSAAAEPSVVDALAAAAAVFPVAAVTPVATVTAAAATIAAPANPAAATVAAPRDPYASPGPVGP